MQPVVFCRAQHPVFLHSAQNVSEPTLGARRLAIRAEIVRPLGQAGEQCALLQGELARRLVEIVPRRTLNAPRAAAEIDGVEIEFQDLVLAERGLNSRRDNGLANLSLVGSVFAHQQVLDELLRYRRTSLAAAGLREIVQESADQASFVNALVLVKALVFGRDERVSDVEGHLIERNPAAALVVLKHVGEMPAAGVEQDSHAWKSEAVEFVAVRKVGCRFVVEVDDLAEVDRGLRSFLAFAELSIGGVQVTKVDAAELLVGLTANRLRIIHGGLNEVIDVDILDRKGVKHVLTAGLQHLRDLPLIPIAAELRFHRAWIYRDLAKRQRRGKDFDENRFHSRPEFALIRSLSRISAHKRSGNVAISPIAQPTSNHMAVCRKSCVGLPS